MEGSIPEALPFQGWSMVPFLRRDVARFCEPSCVYTVSASLISERKLYHYCANQDEGA